MCFVKLHKPCFTTAKAAAAAVHTPLAAIPGRSSLCRPSGLQVCHERMPPHLHLLLSPVMPFLRVADAGVAAPLSAYLQASLVGACDARRQSRELGPRFASPARLPSMGGVVEALKTTGEQNQRTSADVGKATLGA